MWEGEKAPEDWSKCAQVDAIKYDRSKVVMAKRIYPVHSHVKYGYRYAPLVSRQHGKAPRVAWTAFHNIQLAPPNLPRVRSSRTLISDRSLSQGAPSRVLPPVSPHMSCCKPDAKHGHPCDTMHIFLRALRTM